MAGMKDSPFYMVYREVGDPPRAKHLSYEDADREAQRIARIHPGCDVYVIAAVTRSKVPLRDIDFEYFASQHDTVPF